MHSEPPLDEQPNKWVYKPFIGRYTPIDFARTGMAIFFIMLCMSFLTLYLHQQVDEASEIKAGIHVEYVNMLREDVYDPDNNIILQAPEMVIDRILEFPVSYDKLDIQGYILLDTVTGVKYLYLRNEFGISFTKYWTKEELTHFDADGNITHEFEDKYKDRPTRFGPENEDQE